MGTPAAEVEIDERQARQLLAAQHPDLAELSIVAIASGWDNQLLRLGDKLVLRFPRRKAAAQLMLNEQRWLPLLQERLPLAVPAPVRLGIPQFQYPWAWSVTPWIEGDTADRAPPDANQGERLAAFFEALHQSAPADAPHNPYRGVHLSERADAFADRLKTLHGKTDILDRRVGALWSDALAAANDAAPTWIHGDLHPRNVLINEGRLTGVIDWGDLARGDRAADLAAVWMLLPQMQSRRRAMAACRSVSDATWRRARGWALLFAVILLTAGLVDDARMVAIAERTIKRLWEGP
ncbi:MAG TPA: aminoglycoside phosphotransferase family protein [Steroidobacteraceae bacterium]|jgi:aminoglycoside phosphotransferase (APT) family kinase protein